MKIRQPSNCCPLTWWVVSFAVSGRFKPSQSPVNHKNAMESMPKGTFNRKAIDDNRQTKQTLQRWYSAWRNASFNFGISPRGLTFTWWDVTVYVKDINQPSLPTPFYSIPVSVSVLWPFQLYLIPKNPPTTLRFLTLFFRSYLCLIGPFNCMSLYESLIQPWYKSLVVDWAQSTS